MFKFSKLNFFNKYFFLLLFINMNNNIFCGTVDKLVNLIYDIYPGTNNILSMIFGYQTLFFISKDEKIQKISFFNKAVILFLE